MESVSAIGASSNWPVCRPTAYAQEAAPASGASFKDLLVASLQRGQVADSAATMADAAGAELALRAANEVPRALIDALNEIKDLRI